MAQNFTPNDLIRFAYRETTASETLRIEQALADSPELRAEYERLRRGRDEYPRVKFSAPAATLQAVLSYSRKATLETSF